MSVDVRQPAAQLPPVPPGGTPSSRDAGSRLSAASLRVHAPTIAAVLGLTFATWLYQGYRYIVFPQPGFLDWVLRYDGALQNDWQTGGPPPHWVIANVLGVFPSSWLEGLILALWIVTLLVLWGAFLDIGRSLGMPLSTGVALGLVLLATHIGGFGDSQILYDFFYASMASFALSLAGLAALLRERRVLAGAFVGAAILLHPRVGMLALATTLLAVLVGSADRRRDLVRFLGPALLIGGPALLQIYLSQAAGDGIPASERLDLEVTVRGPTFLDFPTFSSVDYARTVVWVAALGAGLALLWRTSAARRIAVVAASAAAVILVGFVATEARWPLSLVLLQTSHLSALLVFLGVVVSAAALQRFAGGWTPALLLGVFLLAPFAVDHVWPYVYQYVPATKDLLGDVVGISAVEGLLVLVCVGALLVLRRNERLRDAAARAPAAAVTAAVGVMAAITLVSLVVEHDSRTPGRGADQEAYRDVALHARAASAPTDIVMTPPSRDAFRSFSHRPIVLEWGEVRHSEGFREWKQRIIDLTGEPRILDPGFVGSDILRRQAIMERDYDHTVATDRGPVCRYGAKLVVAGAGVRTPPWLRRIYANRSFALFKVRGGACSSTA